MLNIHRLLPSRIIGDVSNMKLPLQSREGFIRQILGWREFVRHVHLATDGFRRLPFAVSAISKIPGDGGYQRWAGKPWTTMKTRRDPDGGAVVSFLDADHPLPPAYWGKPSGLSCLDHVVADVWAEGHSHHITRLMVLSNIAALLDVSPRELTDWFWVAYMDAYDWVVEPNVLGMGTFALGDLMTTKPYISGASYIHRMSDFCSACSFDPGTNCPFSSLYWAFLARHENKLKDNPRLRMPMASLRRRSLKNRERDQGVFEAVRKILDDGGCLSPRELSGD
jgi:deoxyribodipyrimidine photolyase-related protein